MASARLATPGNLGLVALLALLWGAGYPLVGVVVETLPPTTATAGRLFFGFLVLAAILAARGRRLPVSPALWARYAVVGISGNLIPFFLVSWGQVRIDSGLAAILISPVPIFTLLIASGVSGDERLTVLKAVGTVTGMLGIVVLIGPDALEGLGGHLLGQLALLGAALSFALSNIASRLVRHQPALVNATAVMLVSTLAIFPFMVVLDRPWTLAPGPLALGAMVTLGAGATGLASLVFFRLIARTSATFTGLANYLVPVVSLGLGVLLLAERGRLGRVVCARAHPCGRRHDRPRRQAAAPLDARPHRPPRNPHRAWDRIHDLRRRQSTMTKRDRKIQSHAREGGE